MVTAGRGRDPGVDAVKLEWRDSEAGWALKATKPSRWISYALVEHDAGGFRVLVWNIDTLVWDSLCNAQTEVEAKQAAEVVVRMTIPVEPLYPD